MATTAKASGWQAGEWLVSGRLAFSSATAPGDQPVAARNHAGLPGDGRLEKLGNL